MPKHTMPDQTELTRIRERIDNLDDQLLKLISERAEIAKEVAIIKGRSSAGSCYRPEREAQILRKIKQRNPGPMSDKEIARLLREIMSACLALEQPLRIAYLGPEGTFTHTAARKHFGHSVTTESFSSIAEVFRDVASSGCDFGVVPVENSLEGVVNHTLDSFTTSSLHICGEVELKIHHHLLGRATELKDVRHIYTHNQTLAQCRRWLDAHVNAAQRIVVSSNAEAARIVAHGEGAPGAVAIAGEAAADIYELEVLARNIEDETDNTTRFLVIGSDPVPPSGDDKTSILFSTTDKPGALHEALGVFAELDISMSRIESRPSRREMWDYVFFVDLAGHKQDENIATALARLGPRTSWVKRLGSYPRAAL